MMNKLPTLQQEIYLDGHYPDVIDGMMRTIFHDSPTAYSQLIIGDSGVGKTTITQHVIALLNQNAGTINGVPSYPAVYVRVRNSKSTQQLLKQILEAIGVTKFHRNDNEYTLINRIKSLISAHGIKTIFLDEMQNALTSTHGQKLLEISKTIAGLIDETNIPYLIVGTIGIEKILQVNKGSIQFRTEEQLARRFKANLPILKFPHNAIAWLEMINLYLKLKGCGPISIAERTLIYRIHQATDGKVGELKKLFDFTKFKSKIINQETVQELRQGFDEGFNSIINPFDTDSITDREIDLLYRKGSH